MTCVAATRAGRVGEPGPSVAGVQIVRLCWSELAGEGALVQFPN